MISIRNLTIAVAVAALLSGCTDDLYFTHQAGNCQIYAINAPVENSDKTRTAYDPTEYTSGEIGVNWLPSDMIGVFSDSGDNNVPFSNQSDSETASTSFVGNLTGDPTYVYFPYTPEAGTDPSAIRGSIPSLQHYSTITRALESDWKIGTWVSDGKFRFEHLFSFLRFEVNAEGSEVEGERLKSITLTIPSANLCGEFTCNLNNGNVSFDTPATDASTMTMEWSDTPELKRGTFYGFMTCAPVGGIAGKDIEITINTNRHRATFVMQSKVDEIKANAYYTIPLNLLSLQNNSDFIWVETEDPREQAPWVSGLESKLACSNMVFSLPNTPFMHKIRVKDDSQTVEAYGLPEGLRWNAKRRLVEGSVAAEGDYTYSVEVRNADGSVAFAEGVKLKVSSNLIQPTPMMGWQSWNVLESNIGHDVLLAQAQKMVELGLRDAGYVYLGVDDFWSKDFESRDQGTNYPTVNTRKFPQGMKKFTDEVHALGLKVGIYTDAGNVTCGKDNTGSYDYEEVDARAFTEWGFDMLKEDWYTTNQLYSWPDFDYRKTDYKFPWKETNSAYTLYKRMGDAIAKNGNKLLLYMCEWGIHDPYKWAAETGATCWRVTYDGRDGWNGTHNTGLSNNNEGVGIGLRNAIDLMRHLWPYNGVNHYNDPDMICVGIRGNGGPSSGLVDGTIGLNDDENETAFVMWCMWSSPILLGMDLTRRDLNQHDMNLLKNKELIDINQDPMGQAAEFIKAVGSDNQGKNVDYYMKDLANGDVAIAVVNLSEQQKNFSIDFSDYNALDPTKTYKVRDLLKKSDAGTLSDGQSFKGSLKKHACVVYRLSAQ